VKVGIVYSKTGMQALEDEIYGDNSDMKGKTLKAIKNALSEAHYVSLVNEDDLDLDSLQVDAVFNLSTGVRGESRQSHIPALLERLGVPYTGSGVLTHAVGLSKPKSKEIFIANNIPTPPFQRVENPQIGADQSLDFPLIVKPEDGGSSRGIRKVASHQELSHAVTHTKKKYGRAIVEEFIEGKEITVGIMGNERLKILPILETDFDGLEKSLYDFKIKSKIGYTTGQTFPANVTEHQKKKVKKAAVKAYRSLRCRDYARVDIRLQDSTPYVLEVNTLPGLYLNYSAIPAMVNLDGMPFSTLIRTIFCHMVERSTVN
jgi:D-alanine-D-alanine ligase